MEFKLIKKFLPELKIEVVPDSTLTFNNSTMQTCEIKYADKHYINASDLEAELAKGVEVYGVSNSSVDFGSYKQDDDTHSGLLIGYKSIPKETAVSKSELIAALGNGELAKRIEKYGVENA